MNIPYSKQHLNAQLVKAAIYLAIALIIYIYEYNIEEISSWPLSFTILIFSFTHIFSYFYYRFRFYLILKDDTLIETGIFGSQIKIKDIQAAQKTDSGFILKNTSTQLKIYYNKGDKTALNKLIEELEKNDINLK